jgi:guanine nucleotide-binding protein G(I)/G(S)/G(T) subunit beta-1
MNLLRRVQQVSASQDGNMIIWDGNSARKEHAIPLRSSWVMTCAYGQCAEDNPDPSSLVACGGLDNVLSVYDVNKDVNRPVSELSGHEGYLSCCRFIGESKVLTASGDAKCIYWDLDRETQTSTFDEHSMDVMCVAVSPTDKNMFASGSVDETMKVWDIRSGKCTHTFGRKGDKFHTSDINSVAFFPEGWSIGTGSDDSTCRIFDIRCYGQLSNFEVPNTGIAVTSVAFSKSGRLLFAGYDDNKCHAWDLFGDAEQPSCVMREHSARISCLGVTPNGHALCTGSWDTHLRIWA